MVSSWSYMEKSSEEKIVVISFDFSPGARYPPNLIKSADNILTTELKKLDDSPDKLDDLHNCSP